MLTVTLPADAFQIMLVFARVGAALMLLPGLGEASVSPQIRLAVALLFALAVAPLVAPVLPGVPGSPLGVLMVVGQEVLVGLFFGLLARIMMAALQIGGMIAAYQMGLANAFSFDPTAAQQGALVGAFLSLLGVMVIFATETHHLVFAAVVRSYDVFVPGRALPWGDLAAVLSDTMARSFVIAAQITAPLLIVGTMFYAGLGLLGRLMPQIQVFFIALPVQIAIGILVLMISLSAMMMWFLAGYGETFASF